MITLTKEENQVDQSELEQRVKKMYREVALHPEVTYHFEMGRALAERLGYPAEILDNIPQAAIDSFAGVGYYFDLLKLKMGEHVVDLGSGSGMDVFFAARQVGPKSDVIGIDMTKEQLLKSASLRDQSDFGQVFFLESYIENLPIISERMDAVISNGVINLSGNKAKVFKEAARVLKPGGRFAIADIVTSVKLPESISCNVTLWASCIGGAMLQENYFNLIEDAGLRIVEFKENPYQFISKSAKGASMDYGIKSVSLLAVKE